MMWHQTKKRRLIDSESSLEWDFREGFVGCKGACNLAEALQKDSCLRSLDLFCNGIDCEGVVKIASALRGNTALTSLNLFYNGIGDVGASELAGALRINSTLATLNISWTGIGDAGATELAGALRVNTSLTSLNMARNPMGRSGALAIGMAVASSRRQHFELLGVQLSQVAMDLGLPACAESWGNPQILVHLAEPSLAELVTVRRVKLMVVGHAGAGKSCLVRRLQTGRFDAAPAVLCGLNPMTWEAPCPDGGTLEIRGWDFSGKPACLPTNPFFVTRQSIFLVVWNAAGQQTMEQAVREHVDVVRCRVGLAIAVVLVSTHADLGDAPMNVEERMRAMGLQGARHVHVSSITGFGVKELEECLAQMALAMPHVLRTIPRSYLQLERELGVLTGPCGALRLELVRSVGKEKCGMNSDQVGLALQVLSDWGCVLHFENADDLLRSLIFIDPVQLSGLVERVITSDSLKQTTSHCAQGAILSHQLLIELWGDQPEAMRPALLAMLHACEVAYPLPDGTTSLVPALLTAAEPDVAATWLEAGPSWAAVSVELSYLPLEMFPMLLANTMRYAALKGCWSGGSLLEREGNRAVLRLELDAREVQIECGGALPLGLRGVIFQNLKRLLADRFPGVAHQRVLVGCPRCRAWACSEEKLARRLQAGRPTVECDRCDQTVQLVDMLPGIALLDQVELDLQRDLAQCVCDGDGRPERHELLRRDLLRVLHRRLGRRGLGVAAVGPRLWVPVCRATANGRGWRVTALCEHAGGWHAVGGCQGRVESVDSDYFCLTMTAVDRLSQDCVASAEARAAAASADVGDPIRGDALASLLRSMWLSAASQDGCGCGLERVDVPDGPPQWLCPQHAAEAAQRTRAEFVQPGEVAVMVQWMRLELDGQWMPYDVSQSNAIETAFQRGVAQLYLSSGYHPRRIDFALAVRADGTQEEAWEQDLLIGSSLHVRRRVFFPEATHLPDGTALGEANSFSLQALDPGSALWDRVQRRVRTSLPSHRVVSIKRVLNRFLWDRYCVGSWRLARNRGGRAGERELFHHSADLLDVVSGTTEAGFDPRMKKSSGVEYGRGIYFAEHAAYSVAYGQGWLQQGEPPAGRVTVLIALVVLGDCKDFGPLCSSYRGDAAAAAAGVQPGLRGSWGEGEHRNRPPVKDGGGERELYDSVSGTEADLAWSAVASLRDDGARLGRQYVVFDQAHSYPYLLVELEALPGDPDLDLDFKLEKVPATRTGPRASPPPHEPTPPSLPSPRQACLRGRLRSTNPTPDVEIIAPAVGRRASL